ARRSSGRVTVALRESGGRAQVEIADDSGGLDAVQETLFEPLYSAKTGSIGLGLGLPMGRRLMERVGGSLRLKSQPPYTAVRLEWPLQRELRIVRKEESPWAGRRGKV